MAAATAIAATGVLISATSAGMSFSQAAKARKQGEMGGKPAIRTYFAGVVTGKKTTRSWQVWSRGSERIQGGNNGRPTGARCDMDGHK